MSNKTMIHYLIYTPLITQALYCLLSAGLGSGYTPLIVHTTIQP